MKLGFALALALASAITLNWGYVAQHGAASTLPPLSLRRPFASLRALFTQRRWLAGFVAGLGGWVLYVAAHSLPFRSCRRPRRVASAFSRCSFRSV